MIFRDFRHYQVLTNDTRILLVQQCFVNKNVPTFFPGCLLLLFPCFDCLFCPQALLLVLRKSQRSRTVFRKVGGFVYVTSLLVAMERSLCSPPKNGWEKVNQNQVFELLHTVFCTLTAAMRYEPANSHFFKTEIQYEKLADAVRLLGCFSDLRKISPLNVFPSNTQLFQRLLDDDLISLDSVSPTLRHCSKLFIYLYKVATDSFDRYDLCFFFFFFFHLLYFPYASVP